MQYSMYHKPVQQLSTVTVHQHQLVMASSTSSAFHPAKRTGLSVEGGDLHGDSDHPTVLDCPTRVVGCGCRGNVASTCRSGIHEHVLINPSNGVPVTGVELASTACGWASGEEACVADGREGYCSVVTQFHFLAQSQFRCTSALV